MDSILNEAHELVHRDRGDDYGHPLDDFSRTAKMITGVLSDLLRPGVEIPAERVAMIMICVKLSREVNKPKRDNRVDIAGYTETLEMVYDERKRREHVSSGLHD